MFGITAAVAATFGVLGLILRPGSALGILVISMLVWPEFLRLPVGPAQMSVPRLVAILLVIRLVAIGRNKNLNLCSVDWLVFFLWLWTVVASILGGAETTKITQMIGQGFDTVLMYFVARLSVRSAEDMKALVLPLVAIGSFMFIAGWYESITTSSFYAGLHSYQNWQFWDKGQEFRLGLMRAKVSTSVHIYFGMAMMLIAGILWSLKNNPEVRKLSIYGAMVAAIGAFSSMSSGPWLAIFVLIVCNAYLIRPNFIKPTLYCLLALAIFLEIASNRHFYNLIDYLALNSGTAWYRTKLLEVAASQWRDYWLFGQGDKSIQYWGGLLDGRKHIDLVNHFVIVAVNGGIAAMLMYLFSHINAIRYSIRARKKSKNNIQRNYIFGLVSCLVALDISSMSVGLFGPPLLLSNVLLGLIVSASVAWRDNFMMDGVSMGKLETIKNQ